LATGFGEFDSLQREFVEVKLKMRTNLSYIFHQIGKITKFVDENVEINFVDKNCVGIY
jgi:hypothetical protein